MRTLVPADSLVYLETNDLAAALQPIVDSKPFNEVAKYKPDLSALKGVQFAVAVTGFETSEEKVDNEQVIGRIEPHFVAIADTHAWNFQAVGFAEKKLGSFVEKIYDSPPTLEKTDKHGGKYFTWTAADGRKAYALVIDSLIYFGNDESSIDKCLEVRRGESDSIAKIGKVQSASQNTLASGYVGTDGIAQIANIIGLQFASESSEDSEIQSAIAGIVPQLLRNSITEITWTSTKTAKGIEDKYSISLKSEHASILKETLIPAEITNPKQMLAFVPPDAFTATRYNLKNPQLAWRSLLLVAGNSLDEMNAKILNVFSEGLLESYGITDPETFLGAVDSEIWTVSFDADREESAIVTSYDSDEALRKIKASLTGIDFDKPFENTPMGIFWASEDRETALILSSTSNHERFLMLGDFEAARKCVQNLLGNMLDNKEATPRYRGFYETFAEGKDAVAVTYGKEATEKTVELLSNNPATTPMLTNYATETRFTKTGIERKTTSDFGLIGSIIAQLAQD